MNAGEILMAAGAGVWLAGEGYGLFHKTTTSHFVKLWAKTRWYHRAGIVLAATLLTLHFNGLFF